MKGSPLIIIITLWIILKDKWVCHHSNASWNRDPLCNQRCHNDPSNTKPAELTVWFVTIMPATIISIEWVSIRLGNQQTALALQTVWLSGVWLKNRWAYWNTKGCYSGHQSLTFLHLYLYPCLPNKPLYPCFIISSSTSQHPRNHIMPFHDYPGSDQVSWWWKLKKLILWQPKTPCPKLVMAVISPPHCYGMGAEHLSQLVTWALHPTWGVHCLKDNSGDSVTLPKPFLAPTFHNKCNHMLHAVPLSMTPFIGHQRWHRLPSYGNQHATLLSQSRLFTITTSLWSQMSWQCKFNFKPWWPLFPWTATTPIPLNCPPPPHQTPASTWNRTKKRTHPL